VFNLTPGSAIARITQALLQHGPCEAASAPLLPATAELPFCQDGSFPFRARHPRRLCSCESKSKNQAAHRVWKVRQVVGNGGSVRVLFAVAVAWLCAPMSAGSSAQYQTPATPRVVIREPGTFAGSGGVLCLCGRACETRPRSAVTSENLMPAVLVVKVPALLGLLRSSRRRGTTPRHPSLALAH
jgi:hypothetical protein